MLPISNTVSIPDAEIELRGWITAWKKPGAKAMAERVMQPP